MPKPGGRSAIYDSRYLGLCCQILLFSLGMKALVYSFADFHFREGVHAFCKIPWRIAFRFRDFCNYLAIASSSAVRQAAVRDRKITRLNSSHGSISYAVF